MWNLEPFTPCIVNATHTLWAPGCLHGEHSLTRHWHQWGFMAKMSLTIFIKSRAHKRAWCLIKNTFLWGKRRMMTLWGGAIRHSIFLICYFKMAVWTSLQSKRYLLRFSLIMTSDPQQVKYAKIQSKRHYLLKSQPAKNFQSSKFI